MTAVHEPHMRVELPPRDLTLDDVAQLAAADELHRYELDEGKLLVMPPPDAEHSALIMRIGAWLISHGYDSDRVLATPGVRITERSTGRIPDVVLLSKPAPAVVWLDPVDVLVAVEIVSPGSEDLDRVVKPREYARAGIPHFWRVERDHKLATVHMYSIGVDDRGEPAYFGHRAIQLDELLAGEPPQL